MAGDTADDALSPILFTYEYARNGWAHASISDGAAIYYMAPSYVPTDPLFELTHALVEVLRYGGAAGCTWFYEPAEDRWTLRREGDALHIAIRVGRGFSRPGWPEGGGEVRFAARCDLWQFAGKLRLAASRLVPAHETEYDYDPSGVQRTAEYRALCAFLDEHKPAVRDRHRARE
jgi:hypothetical protein